MRTEQIEDFFNVLSQERVSNFCITSTGNGNSIVSMHGYDKSEVGGMLIDAMKGNKEVENIIFAAVISVISQRSEDPRKTTMELVKIILR
jgi:hypothetical protein